MKKSIFVSTLLSAVTLSFIVSCSSAGNDPAPTVKDSDVCDVIEVPDPIGFRADTLSLKEGSVQKGQFFSTLLNSLGMGASEAYTLTQVCDSVFDVRSLRVGNAYKAYYSGENLRYLVYDRDRVSSVVFDCMAPYSAWVYEKPITYVDRFAEVTINSSLWNDMRAADVSPLLILELSDIYAWTVDFFGLQKGDRFKVLYQEKLCAGEVVSVDTVRYAVFSHGGTEFPAIMFDQKDNGNIWWNFHLKNTMDLNQQVIFSAPDILNLSSKGMKIRQSMHKLNLRDSRMKLRI